MNNNDLQNTICLIEKHKKRRVAAEHLDFRFILNIYILFMKVGCTFSFWQALLNNNPFINQCLLKIFNFPLLFLNIFWVWL